MYALKRRKDRLMYDYQLPYKVLSSNYEIEILLRNLKL